MPAPDLKFHRIAACAFLGMVAFPGFLISIFLITHPLLDYEWLKLAGLVYLALPAFLAMETGVAEAHFIFWMPQPVTVIGWLLVFLFYSALSVFVAWMIFLIRTRRGRKNVSA